MKSQTNAHGQNLVSGIHHITAIASDPQRTVEFYTQILGLRLVKKSVNQDQVEAYHLFFGDRTGEPGMDLTFFTFPGIQSGTRGLGQVTKISLAVSETALPFWQKRFEQHQVKHDPIVELFETKRLGFYDFDGQQLELVGVKTKQFKPASKQIWTTSQIGSDQAIGYFYAATLTVKEEGIMGLVLTHGLGYTKLSQTETLSQYKLAQGQRAVYLEIDEQPQGQFGLNAAGTVHHIAFGVTDEAHQLKLSSHLQALGLQLTEVIDRYYFKSVYFRTPSGILFELATMGPGFTVDESEDELGQKLALPPFLEPQRREIERNLVKI